MEVEITVTVGGRLVRRHVAAVAGTLEQMEETIHALSRRVAADALQASVERVAVARPLFQKTAAKGGTAGIAGVPSSD